MKSICLLLLLALSGGLIAATVDTNHSAALISPGEVTEWEKTQAGLLAVLSKKSGLPAEEINSQYLVDESFKSVALRSYFEDLPAQADQDALWYHMVVDSDKLHQFMLDQDMPVWPDRRSEVYVWVVEEYEDQPLRHASSDSIAVYWLKKWFDVLGIPAIFYDASAEDLLNFQPNDVRFLNPDLIDYLQANNEIGMSLLVFIQHTGTGYSYRIGLTQGEQPVMIRNLKFIDLAAGMKSMAHIVQSTAANDQRLFATEFNQNTVSITVNDLLDADHMLKLLAYFENHALIEQFQVSQYHNNQIKLMLRIEVLPDTFVKFVEKEGLLEHVPLDLGQSILFKWVP